MTNGDIIEVITTDEHSKKTVRRVRVERLSRVGGKYSITGVNMHGEYPKQYLLPLRSHKGTVPKTPNLSAWVPCLVTAGEV